MDIYLGGKRVRLDPSASIGKGGEADIFDLGDGRVLKVWKTPDHPDYAGWDAEQDAARERIEQHQQKLRAFPAGLPPRVIAPGELATDRRGVRIAGYAMPFIQGAEALMRCGDPSRSQAGISVAAISRWLQDLHGTVESLHRCGVVIGDFNDLNVLVKGSEAFIIDTDSFQFGAFLCRVFTERFVDPLLCDASLSRPWLAKPYSRASDWYAFAVMVMQSLLCVGPYGGVFKPKSRAARIPHAGRPLHRITVFHPDVQYPKPAVPYHVLPDDLLQELHGVFEKDRREVFPRQLLSSLEWRRCPACDVEHARAACPSCTVTPPSAVKESTTVRGQVLATRIFVTHGMILMAAVQEGELRVLFYENGQLLREDRRAVLAGAPDPSMGFAIQGKATLISRGGKLFVLSPEAAAAQVFVDSFGTRPVFAANERFHYWVRAGRLLRSGAPAGEGALAVGDVLAGQTLFWVGDRFGFGFYRAGDVSVAFVFDAEKPGIKDTVKLPFLGGQLVAAECVMGERQAWVFFAAVRNGRTTHQCVVVRDDGAVLAMAEGEAGDGSWLGSLRGKCAAAGLLLSATDGGLVRVEMRAGALVETRHFPDTEPFVTQDSGLLAGPKGLFVVDGKSIVHLKMT